MHLLTINLTIWYVLWRTSVKTCRLRLQIIYMCLEKPGSTILHAEVYSNVLMSGRDKIYTCLLRRLHCNKHPHSRLRNIARSDDKSRYLTKKWSRDWRNREVFPYTWWYIWMAFLWHLILADWISTLILWQTLCWKLDDGFASVMRSRHLTSNSGMLLLRQYVHTIREFTTSRKRIWGTHQL